MVRGCANAKATFTFEVCATVAKERARAFDIGNKRTERRTGNPFESAELQNPCRKHRAR